ncbi:MAG: septum formation initiator family protein [Petrimonas sp.]|nr:septum formation initiator family protein [Petrimonas sp.]
MDFRKIVKKRVLSLSVYQIAILIALIAMLFFFSDSSLLKRIKYENEIRDLKAQIEYYRNQTDTDMAKLNELQSNLENLEKYARENYLMKKENEEIFVIE